jgi:hypothetical protein
MQEKYAKTVSEETIESIVKDRLKEELKAGVQTIQYQINTLMTTNGQSPFVTLFLHLEKDDPYIKENAMIIEEVLRQRLEGIKNDKGVYVTPAFPKLVYVLNVQQKECIQIIFQLKKCVKIMKEMYSAQWDVEAFFHHGKMKMEIINLKEDSIKVL